MTDLEKEMIRQIHELDKELKELRERMAVVESKTIMQQPVVYLQYVPPLPVKITYAGSTGIAGRD